MIRWGCVTIVRCLCSQLLVRLMDTTLGSGITTHQPAQHQGKPVCMVSLLQSAGFSLGHHGVPVKTQHKNLDPSGCLPVSRSFPGLLAQESSQFCVCVDTMLVRVASKMLIVVCCAGM